MVDADDPLREHVSLHIYKKPQHFKIKNLDAPSHYNYPDIFLEIDTEEDFKLIEIIINNFFNKNQYYFSLSQILDFLNKNSDLKK